MSSPSRLVSSRSHSAFEATSLGVPRVMIQPATTVVGKRQKSTKPSRQTRIRVDRLMANILVRQRNPKRKRRTICQSLAHAAGSRFLPFPGHLHEQLVPRLHLHQAVVAEFFH